MDLNRFFAKRGKPETAIDLPGGKLVVPGHAKTERGLLTLVTKALKAGKARIEVVDRQEPVKG